MNEPFKIGSLSLRNRVMSAPMAGISDMATRYLASKMGAGLTVTEMVSSKGLIIGDRKTLSYTKSYPDAKPYAVQLFGCKVADLADAAEAARDLGADIVDLNLGCPVRKILKSGCGGALLKDLDLIAAILKAMRARRGGPFTIKIRAGWDQNSKVAVEVAHIAEMEGVNAVTIHPRFVSEGFHGVARWDIIREVASSVAIPVIGNGDINSAEDALRMTNETGCAAVMVGRGAMGNPFIFREIEAAFAGEPPPMAPTPAEKCAVALVHFDMMRENLPPRVSVWLWRKHLCWYAKGLPGVAEFRRDVFSIEDPDTLKALARRFFGSLESRRAEDMAAPVVAPQRGI